MTYIIHYINNNSTELEGRRLFVEKCGSGFCALDTTVNPNSLPILYYTDCIILNSCPSKNQTTGMFKYRWIAKKILIITPFDTVLLFGILMCASQTSL